MIFHISHIAQILSNRVISNENFRNRQIRVLDLFIGKFSLEIKKNIIIFVIVFDYGENFQNSPTFNVH